MLPIRTVFLMTFAISTASIAENNLQSAHQHHHHHDGQAEQDEDCPICMEAPTSQQMMCENGHSMGCNSCVEAIAAKAAREGVESQCPMCRKTFDLDRLKAQGARDGQAERIAEPQPEIQPILVDREAMIRQIIEQERQNLLADLGEVGLLQMRAEHLDTLRQEIRDSFTQKDVLETQAQERLRIIDEIRIEVRRQLVEQERQNLLNELGEQGRRRIREEHLLAFRQEVRDSFTGQEVLQAQDQERRAIIREIQTELRRQQDASIRQEQRTLAQTGQLILINALEKAQIEQDELSRMQNDERNRIRHTQRDHIIRNRVQLVSEIEREGIMQAVFNQLQQAEIARKMEVTNVRRKSIERNLYMRNAFIWLANFVPFMNIAYYNYVEDVAAQLNALELSDPA